MKLLVTDINKIKIISLIFLAVFSFFFFTGVKKSSAADCAVEYARWSVPDQLDIKNLPSGWYSTDKRPAVKIDVLIKNCAGEVAEVSIVEDDTAGIDDDISELDDMEISIPSDSYNFSINLTSGETECENFSGENNDCEYFIKVDLAGAGNNFYSDGKIDGNLKYECDGNTVFDPYPCDEGWSFGSFTGQKAPAGECSIVSAEFTPKGKQIESWFDDDKKPEVFLIIKTKKCEGYPIEVSITEADIFGNDDIDDLDNKEIIIDGKYTDPTTGTNTIQIKMKAGETECEIGYGSEDCEYYITVNPPGGFNEYDTKGTANILNYDCDTTCDENWSYLSWSGSVSGVILPNTPPSQDLQGTGQYDLLAPLPVFGSTFNIKGGLTPYLRVIFQLLIGLAGLLSVIMIVIGGIEYMSTDAMSGKEEGRERVTQAILGLIIALGAWLLLNTLNPNLLSLKINSLEQPTPTGGTPTPPPPPSSEGSGYFDADGLAGYNNSKGSCVHTNKITVEHFKMAGNVFTSAHPEVQKNLDALGGAYNELRAQVLKDYGFGLITNSSYRTRTYQRHLFEIFSLYNELVNNTQTECAALKTWVTKEKVNVHGLLGTVADPDKGCGGPHTLGTGIDIVAQGNNIDQTISSGKLDKIVAAAKKIAAQKPNAPYLEWQGIGNDKVHFNLKNPPVGCPKEPLP